MAAGSIVWELLMKTASFVTDTQRAEKSLKQLKKTADEVGKALGTVIASGAAVATFALKQTIDRLDGINDAAERIGTSVEGLSALQYAAQLSADSAQYLEGGLIKLSRAAVDGNDAFKAMGVNVKDSNGKIKDAVALFDEVAEKFKGYSEGPEKAALAIELFGKSGAELIPLLNLGSKGLAEMRSEAEQLGAIISTDTAKAAGDFNDTLDKMVIGGKGVFTMVAADLLPSMNSLSEQMLDSAKNGNAMATASETLATGFRLLASAGVIVGGVFVTVGQAIGGAVGFIADSLVRVVSTAASSITSIGKALKSAAGGDFAAAEKELSTIPKNVGTAWSVMSNGVASNVTGMVDNIKGTAATLDAIWDKSNRKAKALADDPSGGVVAPLVEGEKKGKKAKDGIDKAAKEAEAAMKRMVEEGRRLSEQMQTPFEKLTATQANVGKLAGAGVIDPTTQARALDAAKKQYDDFIAQQYATLSSGLLSQEAEIKASYERRRAEIMALTEVSATEQQDALAALEEKRDKELAAAKLSRYTDLMDEQERITLEYRDRKKQIEDDEALTQAERMRYLGTLHEEWSTKMNDLDASEAKKRQELIDQQKKLVSDGFEGMAGIAKAFAGEQSGVYQAMFAASKAFALADITIKQSQAIAKAWGENNYFVAIGLTAGLAGQFAGLVSSVSSTNFGGTRADGGPVNAGRSYLVGERGPEMFSPQSSGRILPNDMLQPQQASQPIRIVNAFDDGHIDDYLGSDSGERKIVNAVRRNKRALGIA